MNIQGGEYSFLIKADQMCDFVPVVSTVNNLVDLFIKIIVLPQMCKEGIEVSRYYNHLDKKTFTRCTLLLIPVLGQIFVYLGDLLFDHKTFALQLVKINGLHLQTLSKRLRNDKDVVLAAVSNHRKAIKYSGDNACYDEDVMRVVAGPDLKPPVSDREKVLEAVRKDPMAITDFSEFCDDREIMLIALKGNGNLFAYCSDELKDDDEVFLTAVATNPRVLGFASQRIRDSERIVLEALRRSHQRSGAWVLEFATQRVVSNKEAIAIHSGSFRYLNKTLQEDAEVLRTYKSSLIQEIRIDPKAFSFIDTVFKEDPEVLQARDASIARKQILTDIEKDPKVFFSIYKALRKDPDIVNAYNSSLARKKAIEAIKKDPAGFFSLDRKFQEDLEVLKVYHASFVGESFK